MCRVLWTPWHFFMSSLKIWTPKSWCTWLLTKSKHVGNKKVSPFCCCLKNINTCTLYSFKICLWAKWVSRDCFLKDFLEGEGCPTAGHPYSFLWFSYGSLRFPKKPLYTHLQLHHVPSGQFPTEFGGMDSKPKVAKGSNHGDCNRS